MVFSEMVNLNCGSTLRSVPHRIVALRNQGRNGKNKNEIKNKMQTDTKRIGFVVWMLLVFVFASFRGRGLGKM